MSVSLTNVTLCHQRNHPALDAVSLSVAPGERVAVIGASGAGKTTLLRLLATGLRPDRGTVTTLNDNPWRLSGRQRRQLRGRIGLIHQSAPLPPRQRVVTAVSAGRLAQWSLPRALANLVYPLDVAGVGEALARLELADKLYSRCDALSGGQWQRVGIARVLYQRPDLLLADEPVSAMDPRLAAHVLDVLNREAENRGVGLIASLHAVDLALRHFPRVVGLKQGRVLFDKPTAEVTRRELIPLYAREHQTEAAARPFGSGCLSATDRQ